jgi:hypothetical protein
MGYDVTFHPVRPADLSRYLAEPLENPELLDERVWELTRDATHHASLCRSVYGRLPSFKALRTGKAEFGATLGFASAIVAGYLHPYWFLRGGALSFWARDEPACAALLSSLPQAVEGFAGMRDHGRIVGNYGSGAFVSHENLGPLEALLQKRALLPSIQNQLGDPTPLKLAIGYARRHGLGLLEATEIATAGGTVSWPDNLRAAYQKTLKKLDNLRHGLLVRATRDALVKAVRAHRAEIEAEVLDVRIEPGWRLPRDVVELLAVHCPTARGVLADATDTPPEVLDRIAFGAEPRGSFKNVWLHIQVGQNPSASPRTLARLVAGARKGATGILFSVARNPSTPPAVLQRILAWPRQTAARLAIARHPRATPALLAQLADDSYSEIRKVVRQRAASRGVKSRPAPAPSTRARRPAR